MILSQLFKEYNLPCDNIWLDIYFSDNCKYFHFDPQRFHNHENMIEILRKHHRNLTVLIDCHLKVEENY